MSIERVIKCTVVTVGEPSDWEVGSGKVMDTGQQFRGEMAV